MNEFLPLLVKLAVTVCCLTVLALGVTMLALSRSLKNVEPDSEQERRLIRREDIVSWVVALTFFPMAFFAYLDGSFMWLPDLAVGVTGTVFMLRGSERLPSVKRVRRGVEVTTVGRLDVSSGEYPVAVTTVTFSRTDTAADRGPAGKE